MFLDERKIRILEALINDYIITAEPIGSRTIAKKYDLGVSSATIRNEMSDLEDMGLIMQPHASSGRVPSDKGYRLYVDRLSGYRELTQNENLYLKQVILSNINHMDYLMKETAKAISMLTNYTTIVSEPEVKKASIKHIQLIPMDENAIVLVLITDSKVIKNHVIHLKKAPTYEALNNLSIFLNKELKGNTIDSITNINISLIEETLKISKSIIKNIIKAIIDVMLQEQDIEVYTSGVNNILTFPEFSDIEKAKAIFKAFEEKEMLITLLDKSNLEKGSDNIQVVIGSENSLEQMKDCSVIKANYKLGDQVFGAIGIIGPTRMDYYQVSSILNGIVKNLNAVLLAIDIDALESNKER